MARSEIPDYDALQGALADATASVAATAILDLGSGTGVTAQAVLARHPGAALVGVDASPEMLELACELVPDATFLEGRLEDPLPPGPFDLVTSAFAVHHLEGRAKADLFRRIAAVLTDGGRFVLCDVVVPTVTVAEPIPLEVGVDHPSPLDEQLTWLAEAELRPRVVLARDDVAVVAADR
jgi:tRNA (cmo5U34)-methyltransferase